MRMRLLATMIVLALALSAAPSYAATFATASASLTTTLNVTVNDQTAIQLLISTGTLAPGTPCTVTAGGVGDYTIAFGNVNGLGVGTPSCGGVTAVTATNATYATNYQVTPTWSGFTATTATVSLTAPGFVHASTLTLFEGATTGTMTTIPTTGITHNIAVTASGTAISRFLGVQVSNANGAGAFPGTAAASGADSNLVTFTMTVP